MIRYLAFCVFFTWFYSLPGFAEVIFDGTLAKPDTLSGPLYNIVARHGELKGDQLFHSFKTFNLDSTESAIFSGPATVSRIIGRVTGGSSLIDGQLTTSIAGADLYLINPNGIVFGPNAVVDVSGSFYASTADYLLLGEDGRFDATQPADSILTVSPPSAFGFSNPAPAAITLDGSLSTTNGSDITLVGGDIYAGSGGLMAVENGRLGVVSVASVGELDSGTLDTSSFPELGAIELRQDSKIYAGGSQSKVVLRGGRLVMSGTEIVMEHADDQDQGEAVDLSFSRIELYNASISTNGQRVGKGGDIQIRADDLLVQSTQGHAEIATYGATRAGNLNIDARNMRIESSQGDARLFSEGIQYGKPGNIDIAVDTLVLDADRGVAEIAVIDNAGTTVNPGPFGNIVISAQKLWLTNGGRVSSHVSRWNKEDQYISQLTIDATDFLAQGLLSGVYSEPVQAGGLANNILVKASTMTLRDGARIQSHWLGDGNAGSIQIQGGSLIIHGQRLNEQDPNAGVFINGGANGLGDILFEGDSLSLTDGAVLASVATIDGALLQGTVNLQATGRVLVSGTDGFGVPSRILAGATTPDLFGGRFDFGVDVDIQAGEMIMERGGVIVVGSEGGQFENEEFYGGGIVQIAADYIRLDQASIFTRDVQFRISGDIFLSAGRLEMINGSKISTQTTQGDGGNVELNVRDLIYLRDSQISTTTTGGVGSGGDVYSAPSRFFVLNNSSIAANAVAGKGGYIEIATDHYIVSGGSEISASSELGIDGEVFIEAPVPNFEKNLELLPKTGVEPSRRFKNTCTANSGKFSSFVHDRREPAYSGDVIVDWGLITQRSDAKLVLERIEHLCGPI